MSAEIHRIRHDKSMTAEMCLAMCAAYKPKSVVVSLIYDDDGVDVQESYHTAMPLDALAFHTVRLQQYLAKLF